MLDATICQKARLSRDPRFDGQFFTAVKTTGIYCRSICPASPPKEVNVTYFASAIECASSGFRPCLRCRPDSAPHSPAWKGVNASLERAIRLINDGALQTQSLVQLAQRLGISDRYLRQIFNQYLGMSPKRYSLYQQCLFAKQLLQQTRLPIIQVALASGFDSVRRFNDCFKSELKLTPSQMRKTTAENANELTLKLYYRPPFDWTLMQTTLATRAVEQMEWCDNDSYGRSFNWHGTLGRFSARHKPEKNMFLVTIELNEITHLKPIINNIRRILDLDLDIQAVEADLKRCLPSHFDFKAGVRLPGIWSVFEAGIRAILGQQISVPAARDLVTKLVNELGESYQGNKLFPSPQAIADSELTFLKIPASRKQTLHNLAQYYVDEASPDVPQNWLALKGIGPWTVDYARMRGLSDPDVFLASDLGIKKALAKYAPAEKESDNTLDIGKSADQMPFKAEQVSPWGSYLTFQLWSQR
ncbi:DNA-3-methyladenine glycosylase 2 family protein [Shewanella surugensis]|uniref:DNA-3-methyladenine glycosylase II n=1 Tax=Shewanella surugensis TaxID=212020 RepID=A0ABT0L8X0_9GAMM|nr:AlkA N-terminal domain-containing protein [Shewanella surugensis]MCL1124108.1 helix-turn-helix domain-containing protein [Shewanella surugensis]